MPAPRVSLIHVLTPIMILLVALGIYFALPGTNRTAVAPAWYVRGGDPQRGRLAIARYGCGACHVIPGIRTAQGRVGPQLAGLREQMYVAGVLPHRPENLVTWIRQPQEVNPQTAMPDLNVTEGDARDIAAYLYQLR